MSLRIFLIAAVVFCASFTRAQIQFSADIVELQKPDRPIQKLFFANNKIRIEWPDHEGKKGSVLILDFGARTTTVLNVEKHTYMEMPTTDRGQLSYGFFPASEVGNACGDWQEIAHGQRGSCHKLGDDVVNGRNTVKYEATNLRGDVGQFWLDRELRFPVKWRNKVSDGELRNIQASVQPASLFDVPHGFRRTDLPR
jgi:hypothetical protein